MVIQMIISLGSIRHLVGLGSPGAVKSNTNGFRSNHVMMMIGSMRMNILVMISTMMKTANIAKR